MGRAPNPGHDGVPNQVTVSQTLAGRSNKRGFPGERAGDQGSSWFVAPAKRRAGANKARMRPPRDGGAGGFATGLWETSLMLQARPPGHPEPLPAPPSCSTATAALEGLHGGFSKHCPLGLGFPPFQRAEDHKPRPQGKSHQAPEKQQRRSRSLHVKWQDFQRRCWRAGPSPAQPLASLQRGTQTVVPYPRLSISISEDPRGVQTERNRWGKRRQTSGEEPRRAEMPIPIWSCRRAARK